MLDGPQSLFAWHNRFLEQRHFASLDGVRCFCILAVLWHHSIPPTSPQILTRGFLGVDMFFVLSGFLIVTLLLREQSTVGEISLRKFYARRALRIFPIYYGILLLLTLYYAVSKSQASGSSLFFSVLPLYLTFTSNWSLVQAHGLGITWSLAAEEQFYLFWPTIEKLTRKWVVYVVLGVLIAINQLMNFGILDSLFVSLYRSPDAIKLLETTFTPICLGIGLAHLLHQARSFTFIFRSLGYRYIPIVIFIVLLGVMNFSPDDISGFPRLLIHILMTLWLASLVVREDHGLRPLMIITPIARIGKISYGMYLYHIWVFSLVTAVTQFFHNHGGLAVPLPLFVIGTLGTLLIAEISYRFYETPFFKWKAKLGLQTKQ